jgi:hypothetical protein
MPAICFFLIQKMCRHHLLDLTVWVSQYYIDALSSLFERIDLLTYFCFVMYEERTDDACMFSYIHTHIYIISS